MTNYQIMEDDNLNYNNLDEKRILDSNKISIDNYNGIKLTPAMKQYVAAKEQYPDCILLFRMGDFYETFFDDAVDCANILDITLTSRGKGDTKAPLAGIPYHALDPYLAKLVLAGRKVAICEQLENPKLAEGIVKRGVIRVVTPGTIIESDILSASSNNYICSIYQKLDKYGISICDMSTGEFLIGDFNEKDLFICLSKYSPKECIIPESLIINKKLTEELKKVNCFIYPQQNNYFNSRNSNHILNNHFGSIDSFSNINLNSSGSLITYLIKSSFNKLSYIKNIKNISISNSLILDGSTIKNLELLKIIHDGSKNGTLISVIDKTKTAMGSRLLKKWIVSPLTDINKINLRLDSIKELISDQLKLEELYELLIMIADLERITARINFGNANPKEIIAIRESLINLEKIILILDTYESVLLNNIKSFGIENIDIDSFEKKDFDYCEEINSIIELINNSIKDDPNSSVRNGNMIKSGFSSELDNLHSIINNSKNWLNNLEIELRQKTGINSLKVGFNKVFGYYIEVTSKNKDQIPDYFIRKQTLANAERFITPDLKEKESIILNAENKINDLEFDIFNSVLIKLKGFSNIINNISNKLAYLDILIGFGLCSIDNSYSCPIMCDGDNLSLSDCRHPVIEISEKYFIKNDCNFDEDTRTMIITGPNMAGKSTFMRQIALIQIMAQIGCFVPASSAKLSIADRIFTRIGAYDDLVSGKSTFMVEMSEVANILHNFSSRSLIILDEIGRGTSTFDGISIAWAVVESIARKNSKCLFATHYHQLNKLSDYFSNVKNFHITVKETFDDIVFLRKIVEGGTDKSYGIQVAKLAGVPNDVIDRSKQIMIQLEMDDEITAKIHSNLKKQKVSSNKLEKKKVDPLNESHYSQENLVDFYD